MRALQLTAAFALILATAGAAQAQEAPAADPETAGTPAAAPDTGAFGRAGEIVISGDLQVAFLHTTFTPGAERGSVFVLQPAADFFVAPNVSLGGFLTFRHSSSLGLPDRTVIGGGARVGYNLGITPAISIWSTVSLAYLHTSADTSGELVPLEIFVPVLFHIADHLFVGLGPVFHTDLDSTGGPMNGVKQTDFGLLSVVGGNFGG